MNDEYSGRGGAYVVVDGKRVPEAEAMRRVPDKKPGEKQELPQAPAKPSR